MLTQAMKEHGLQAAKVKTQQRFLKLTVGTFPPGTSSKMNRMVRLHAEIKACLDHVDKVTRALEAMSLREQGELTDLLRRRH